jgi:hypothetical protein
MIMPLWQKPHCGTSSAAQAFCTGCEPSGESPSMVTIFSVGSTVDTGRTQLRVGTPSRCTVQAPHWATPQPYLVPVRPSCSRRTHSSGVSGSALELAARSKRADGKSVLHGRRTTGLTRQQEMTAWLMTAAWLGSYYRTYPTPLQTEVQSLLARPQDFDTGPPPLLRDDLEHLGRGFTVRDGNYLSARWPGDAHGFALKFAQMLG